MKKTIKKVVDWNIYTDKKFYWGRIVHTKNGRYSYTVAHNTADELGVSRESNPEFDTEQEAVKGLAQIFIQKKPELLKRIKFTKPLDSVFYGMDTKTNKPIRHHYFLNLHKNTI